MSTETEPEETQDHDGCFPAFIIAVIVIGTVAFLFNHFIPKRENPKPDFPPWTVLCDGDSHFTFSWSDGHRDGIYDPFATYKEAEDTMRRLRKITEDEEANKRRVYKVCPEIPKP